jgi:Rrf2 family nitric oxide-sensitive transcriptional repressor
MRLSRPAKDIILGDVVRQTETDFALVECFDASSNQCNLSAQCRLKAVLHQATYSFLAVLDGVTLADLLADPVAPVARTVSLPRSKKTAAAGSAH